MEQKVFSITQNKDEIIFLSDLRLNSLNQSVGLKDLLNKITSYGYTLYHNSTRSSRGVGILISKKIKHVIRRRIDDPGNNFLLLDTVINEQKITLGAIYGPNDDTNMAFFDNLKQSIKDIRNDSVIIGGDWNATWDNAGVNLNIDIVNMANIPSKRRTEKLRQLCTDLKLTDPYRTFYPTRKEYTFIPSAVGLVNRSRLDFFIISENVLLQTSSCNIPHSLTSTVFDHKPVFLSTKRKKIIHKQQINDVILNDPDLQFNVTASVFECYLQHATVNDQFHDARKNELLIRVGRILQNLNRLKILIEDSIEANDNNNLLDMEIEAVRSEIREEFDLMPVLQFFEQLELDCNRSTFFETLVSYVKNITLGHQSWVFKMKNKTKTTLARQIKILKKDFRNNTHNILALERRLSSLIESELRAELVKIKNFERLNNEKITPHFLKTARSSRPDISLDDLKDDNGNFFISQETKNEHITNYYQNIYKKPLADISVNVGDIENFLGATSEVETVADAKLTIDEREELESPITLQELEKSLSEANMASAPGTDGISNKFIKHFWHLFQKPLLDYSNHCFETGTLTDSFRGAKIRLIPKKGDCSKLKNWRPISLLNCFYKILSRVLTGRLRKCMDKLTPIGQKGYSETRHCQEVLIEVSDCVSKCNHRKTKGALLSLDISKAFDTLSHTFLNSVLVFFNFGENFRRWIRILATNRTACIILNENKNSRIFKLERGNAQGDTLSPFLFILCYQILLFKIEYDLQIIGLIEEQAIPETLTPIPAQVCKKNSRVFAYADDGNILVAMDLLSLTRIKEILSDFGQISGLVCNVEKTGLMQLGSNEPIAQDIVDLGFQVVNDMTILGMKIGGHPDQNYMDIRSKVSNQVHFWSRLNLSLPGRIAIAKSMMYSQINYLGCILPFTIGEIQELSLLIENFVKGNLNISRKRLFMKVEEGGLGLFILRDFLDGLRCAWVKRAQKLDENWKRRIYSKSYGNVLNIRAKNFNLDDGPILHGIASSYERFLCKHTMWNENFKLSKIFDNPALTLGANNDNVADGEFFGDFMDNYKSEIYKLVMKDVFDNGYVSLENFVLKTGIPIPQIKLTSLRSMYDTAAVKYAGEEGARGDNTDISTYVNRFKKGSRAFRRVFLEKKLEVLPNSTVRFALNTETIIGLKLSELLNASWNVSYLDNSLRTFIFKLHNNALGFNHVIDHFVDNVEPYCNFCLLNGHENPERDTVLHIFYTCPTIELLLEELYSWIFGGNRIVSRSEVFGNFNEINESNNKILFVVTKIVQKYIWDSYLRKSIPTTNEAKELIRVEMRTMGKVSKYFWNTRDECNLQVLK